MYLLSSFRSLGLLIILCFTLCSFTNVTDEELLQSGVSEELLAQLKNDRISGLTGDIDFPLCHAQINVPDGFVYLDKEQSKKLLTDYWGNPINKMDDVLGAFVPSEATCFYQISVAYVITYDNCGYIKDDDANSIDYSELLEEMKKASVKENKNLPDKWKSTILGWAVPPKYIQSKHVLIWARLIEFGGETKTVNYDMRILGKDGFVSINAVIAPEDTEEVDAKGDDIIDCLSFNKGYAYSDFDPSRDKVSDWTIGGLIAGGILAKTGILAKIGAFLLKFSKILIVGAIAVFAAIIRWFRRRRNGSDIE